MVASCMAYKLGVSIENIRKTIREFQPVEHRLEYIGEKMVSDSIMIVKPLIPMQ